MRICENYMSGIENVTNFEVGLTIIDKIIRSKTENQVELFMMSRFEQLFKFQMSEPIETQKEDACFIEKIVQRIPTEKHRRSLFDSVLIYSHYVADYVILWAVLGLILITEPPIVSNSLPFFAVRAASSLCYIVLRHPLFFLLDKVVVIIQLMIATPAQFSLEMINVGFELLMCAVWALTKEQRQVHFDSSIGLFRIFFKQVFIYLLLLIDDFDISLIRSREKNFLVLIVLLGITAIDLSQFYYCTKMNSLLLRLDQILGVLLIALSLETFLNVSFFEYVLASLGLVLIFLVEFAVTTNFFREVIQMPLLQIQSFDESSIAESCTKMKMLADKGRYEHIDSLIQKIASQETDPQIREKLLKKDKESYVFKKNFIHCFIIQRLRELSKNMPEILDLLIYLYSPDPRIFYCFDLSKWQHRREYFRILTDGTPQTILQQFEFEKQKKQIRGVLFKCARLRHRFYRQLMREKVNQQRVLSLGCELMEIVTEFIEDKKSKLKQSPHAITLFSSFSEECLTPYMSSKIAIENSQNVPEDGERRMGDEERQGEEEESSDAAVWIGVRFERFAKILSVNNQFRRIGGYSFSQSKKLKVSVLFGKEFQGFIRSLIDQENHKKQKQFAQIKVEVELAWIASLTEFLTPCSCLITSSHLDSDYCLRVALKPLFCNKALIAIDSKGQVIGVTELARYFEFYPTCSSSTLDEIILNELRQHKRYNVQKGESLLLGQNLVACEPFTFTVIFEAAPVFLEAAVLLVEMTDNQVAKRANQSICRKIIEPVPFEFSFNWNGKITSFRSENVFPSGEQSEKRKDGVNYGENITEMRYFREKIDYKANFEEERDCPSLPKQLQQNLPEISDEQFFQRVQRRKAKTPTGFKVVIVLLILLLFFSIFASAFMLIQFHSFASANVSNLNLLIKHEQRLQVLQRLSTLTVFSLLNLPYNQSLLIKQQISINNDLSNEIYNIDSSSMSSIEGQELQKNINNLNLVINTFLLNPTLANAGKVLTVMPIIGPSYTNFLNTTVTAWNVSIQSKAKTSLVIIILFTVFSAILLIVIVVVNYQVTKSKEELVEILKSIDNDQLTIYSSHVVRFREEWLQNEDFRQSSQNVQAMEESFSPTKRVAKSGFFNFCHFLHFFWLVLTVLTLVCQNNFTQHINQTIIKYQALASSLSSNLIILSATWSQLNAVPLNPIVVKSFIQLSLNNQFEAFLNFRDIVTNNECELGHFYYNFWETAQFCKYVNQPNCSTIIGQGTTEGGNMVVGFLNHEYDNLYGYITSGKSIYSHPHIQTVGKIIYFYLDRMLAQNHKAIYEDFSHFANLHWAKIFHVFLCGMLWSGSLAAFAVYYWRFFRRHGYHEDILLTIPLQQLKIIPAFHQFYQKYYEQY